MWEFGEGGLLFVFLLKKIFRLYMGERVNDCIWLCKSYPIIIYKKKTCLLEVEPTTKYYLNILETWTQRETLVKGVSCPNSNDSFYKIIIMYIS